MKTLEMRDKISEKLRGVRLKLPIYHLLCVLVYQTAKSMLRHNTYTVRSAMKIT